MLNIKTGKSDKEGAIETMFRMFGKELIQKNPQMCKKYFKAYKNAGQLSLCLM